MLAAFTPRIRAMASRIFPRGLDPTLSQRDLEQAAGLALVRAVRRYDRHRPDGVPFGGYAQQRLRGAMLDLLQVEVTASHTRGEPVESLEGTGDRYSVAPRRSPPAGKEAAPDRRAAACQARQLLARACREVLDARERRIITELFLDSATIRAAGEAVGLGESRVCQLRAGALRKLRERLRSLGVRGLQDIYG